jgi:hypothetical protein
VDIGRVVELTRYPVKSMRGETLLDHSASLEDGSPPVIGCSAAL